MELSTDLLANVTFREQWRGYSPDQVDEFLERLGVAIAELQERVTTAERKVAEAEAANDQDEIMRTLVLAQRTASAAVDEAKQDAARIVAEAEGGQGRPDPGGRRDGVEASVLVQTSTPPPPPASPRWRRRRRPASPRWRRRPPPAWPTPRPPRRRC